MRVARHGLAVDPPPGWDVRIYRRAADIPGATTHAVLHAANFALPANRGDFGSGAVEVMGPRHVLVVLFEYGADSAGTSLFAKRPRPLAFGPEDFRPNQLQRTIPGQAGTQAFFAENGRAFCLYVVLGSHHNRAGLVPLVNSAVGAIEYTATATVDGATVVTS